ncbi:MAG: CPBP family intramembrane metalloprotease [Acidobacteriota bacterium]|nr:CPBP family intramembrane metalloprotease [Acidobacteriota bacterium]MDH3783823.1 CPBP family intramembrane metalloprotease [Acidobacteriota bacterium]
MEKRPYLTSFWFLALLTFISGILAEGAHLFLVSSGFRDRLPPLLAVAIPGFLAGALFPYLVIRWVYRESLASLGIRWWTAGRRSLTWLLVTCGATFIVWLVFWAGLMALLQLAPEGNEAATTLSRNPLTMVLAGESSARLLAVLIYFAVLVGFAEELLGRGLLQNVLDRGYDKVYGKGRFTIRKSTLLAALLFGLWHTEWLQTDPLAILGSLLTSATIVMVPSLLLCVVYERTRGMLVVIVLHNFIDFSKFVAWDWMLRLF